MKVETDINCGSVCSCFPAHCERFKEFAIASENM